MDYHILINKKFCSTCQIEKPAEMFSRQASGRLGRKSTCKACVKKYMAARYDPDINRVKTAKYRLSNSASISAQKCMARQANLAAEKLRAAAYYIANSDAIKSRVAARAIANPEKIKAYSRRLYLKNRENILEKSKAYTAAHPEIRAKSVRNYLDRNKAKTAERGRAYRRNNPEARAATQRRWNEANPVKRAVYSVRRRADKALRTKLHNPELLALVELEMFEEAARLTCETGIPYEVDHVIPLRGKTVSGLHNEHNLQVLTFAANRTKGNRWWPDMP
jgi:5-methylcytosine-specific restriction endonuclease McrA